jgi:uncharacterized membrane protein YphA (DoxX/SURF4 family)
MKILFLIGRIIFGGYFAYSGLNHFLNLSMMAGYAKSKGLPYPSLAVAFTGILLLLGGLSILLGIYPRIGVLFLVLFLLPTTLIMHNFWAVSDPQMKMVEMINFMKNMALLGATLMFLAIPIPWKLSLLK